MPSLNRPAFLAVTLILIAMPVCAADPVPSLQTALDTFAQRAHPGVFGVTVLDLSSGTRCGVNTTRAYPMMSVFKAPVAAAVLARVDAGSLTLGQSVTITRAEVDPGSAVPSIGENFKGERMTFTVDGLLTAAVSQSDNTAVDALIRLVGGSAAVTTFLRAHGITDMRVDEDEAEVARVFAGHDGYAAFLADPRNRSTPDAAVDFLQKLAHGELLSPASTQRLLGLMDAQTVPHRLRAGTPPAVRLADKTGSGPTVNGRIAAYNDIGIFTWPDGHVVIVAAFLMDSPASQADRDAFFADLAREITSRH